MTIFYSLAALSAVACSTVDCWTAVIVASGIALCAMFARELKGLACSLLTKPCRQR